MSRVRTFRLENVLNGDSLFLFGPKNSVRKIISLITKHWLFDATIIAMIIVSSIKLAMENPLEDPHSTKREILEVIDLVSNVVFFAEAAMKIVAMGFLFCGETSYLRNGWNVMDFTVVLSSVFDLASETDVSFLKIFRILRILKPLRLITTFEGLKLALVSLFKAFPSILKLQLIVFFFIFAVGTCLTYLKSGALHYCNLDQTSLSNQQRRDLVKNKWDCLDYGGEWTSKDQNFDDPFQSLLTVFTLQTKEDHQMVLWSFVDSVGVDMQP